MDISRSSRKPGSQGLGAVFKSSPLGGCRVTWMGQGEPLVGQELWVAGPHDALLIHRLSVVVPPEEFNFPGGRAGSVGGTLPGDV